MTLHPGIIALLIASGLISFLALYAAWYGVVILRHWDIGSGSSRQLDLERRTYLISTILSNVFIFQLLSLFLFIYTADSLCTLFTGAMCAAGTLNVNGYGYPVLLFAWVPVIGDAFPLAAGWLRFEPWRSALLLAIGKFARYLVLAGAWNWLVGP